MAFDQVDFFLPGDVRAAGLTIADLQLVVYQGPTLLSWPLVSGAGVTDTRVSAGKVYWTEISPGFYSIRFFPHVVGVWRILVTYLLHNQTASFTYNASVPGATSGVGFKVSFSKG
jgi:hypothetical protein